MIPPVLEGAEALMMISGIPTWVVEPLCCRSLSSITQTGGSSLQSHWLLGEQA